MRKAVGLRTWENISRFAWASTGCTDKSGRATTRRREASFGLTVLAWTSSAARSLASTTVLEARSSASLAICLKASACTAASCPCCTKAETTLSVRPRPLRFGEVLVLLLLLLAVAVTDPAAVGDAGGEVGVAVDAVAPRVVIDLAFSSPLGPLVAPFWLAPAQKARGPLALSVTMDCRTIIGEVLPPPPFKSVPPLLEVPLLLLLLLLLLLSSGHQRPAACILSRSCSSASFSFRGI